MIMRLNNKVAVFIIFENHHQCYLVTAILESKLYHMNLA